MKERKSFSEWDVALAAPLVRRFEGIRTKAYLCPAGVWTIGYGHTRDVHEGDMISLEYANQVLITDLEQFQEDIANVVEVPVSRGEFTAILSFVFNLGIGNFKKSTLLRRLNAKQYQLAADEFPRWVYAGGKMLGGLVKRRAAEKRIFLDE